MQEPNAPAESPPSRADQYAWMRTTLALQRTLFAVARTAIAFIGFGFTVAQFFERLHGVIPESARLAGPTAARNLGLLLIGAGIVTMVIFTWQFHRTARALLAGPIQPARTESVPVYFAASYMIVASILLIGVAAFLSIFLHF